MNVFQKCLRRQMGNQVYHSFYKKCAEKFSQSNLSQLNTNDGHLHDALYECIKKDDFEGLEEKKRDISETLRTADRITKFRKYYSACTESGLLCNLRQYSSYGDLLYL